MPVATALQALTARIPFVPDLAIVLGSGLGALADSPEAKAGVSVPFTDLPGFPGPHRGGPWRPLGVLRVRGAEGGPPGRPLPLLRGAPHVPRHGAHAHLRTPGNVKAVLLTNAAGALNPAFGVGELMALTDHLNFFGTNPLIGPNVAPGPRFPDMTARLRPGLPGPPPRLRRGPGPDPPRGRLPGAHRPQLRDPRRDPRLPDLGRMPWA